MTAEGLPACRVVPPQRKSFQRECLFVPTMAGDDSNPVDCLTGFSAVTVAANVITTEESRSLSQLPGDIVDSAGEEDEPKWGGSRPGKSPNLPRAFEGACNRLLSHCFKGKDLLCARAQFCRRHRVSPAVFERVHNAVHGKGTFHPENKRDATKKKCIHPLVRFLTAVFRMIGCGTSADREDEAFQVSETVVDVATKSFCETLTAKFGDQHLNRTPTDKERKRTLKVNAEKGFPGCFACWGCKHFVWDNCPVAMQGQHKGHTDGGKHTKILEAIADDSCFF